MKQKYLNQEKINAFIKSAFAEDVGSGDHSTLASISPHREGKADLLIKDDGIIAGLELAEMIFAYHDPELRVELYLKDGQKVKKGDIGLSVKGRASSILTSERLMLNCMQRMSGIATKTFHFNKLISHTKAKLLDTRKTTPNFRMLEKWAVSLGGGQNHRFGLYDMIMLKDNHIEYAGGIQPAIEATHAYLKKKKLDLKIEVETRNLEEVREVLKVGGVDYIMLDNMDLKTMRKAVELIGDSHLTEASGGISETTIKDVAECGVDFISVGILTHQIDSMDISLKAT